MYYINTPIIDLNFQIFNLCNKSVTKYNNP